MKSRLTGILIATLLTSCAASSPNGDQEWCSRELLNLARQENVLPSWPFHQRRSPGVRWWRFGSAATSEGVVLVMVAEASAESTQLPALFQPVPFLICADGPRILAGRTRERVLAAVSRDTELGTNEQLVVSVALAVDWISPVGRAWEIGLSATSGRTVVSVRGTPPTSMAIGVPPGVPDGVTVGAGVFEWTSHGLQSGRQLEAAVSRYSLPSAYVYDIADLIKRLGGEPVLEVDDSR